MERKIETMRETPHWSYSALQTYLTCPMRYYFRYIEHAEVERTPISIPFGRAFHLVLSERAMKGTNYTIVDAKEDFAVYFKGETEVCENLTYKPEEDYWFWDKRGCDMLEVALADWPDDYTVKSVAEAFSVDVPGLSKPLVGEFDLVTVDGGDETICDWKKKSTVIFRRQRSVMRFSRNTASILCSASTCTPRPKRLLITSSTRSGRTTTSSVSFTSQGRSKKRSTMASSSRLNPA